MAAPMEQHEPVEKMTRLKESGLSDDEQIPVAFQVYMDLCERQNWWNVHLEAVLDLNEAVVCGHPTATAARETVLPVKPSHRLSVADLNSKISIISHKFQCDSVMVALMGTDSTVTYHRMTPGLVPPDPPELQEEKTKRRRRQRERKRNRMVELKSTLTEAKSEEKSSSSVGGH